MIYTKFKSLHQVQVAGSEDRMPEFMSPVVTPPQPAEKIVTITSTCKKRMRRLRSTIPEPYSEQPSITMTDVPEKTESPHVIVTRRLRSRRK
ncbi:hypothetical protein LSAT2_000982 [Lamellibrachia satsuma]|nr:hypothetical protein LSAT2_000982 [Lamellibrachia satsuma]